MDFYKNSKMKFKNSLSFVTLECIIREDHRRDRKYKV